MPVDAGSHNLQVATENSARNVYQRRFRWVPSQFPDWLRRVSAFRHNWMTLVVLELPSSRTALEVSGFH